MDNGDRIRERCVRVDHGDAKDVRSRAAGVTGDATRTRVGAVRGVYSARLCADFDGAASVQAVFEIRARARGGVRRVFA